MVVEKIIVNGRIKLTKKGRILIPEYESSIIESELLTKSRLRKLKKVILSKDIRNIEETLREYPNLKDIIERLIEYTEVMNEFKKEKGLILGLKYKRTYIENLILFFKLIKLLNDKKIKITTKDYNDWNIEFKNKKNTKQLDYIVFTNKNIKSIKYIFKKNGLVVKI